MKKSPIVRRRRPPDTFTADSISVGTITSGSVTLDAGKLVVGGTLVTPPGVHYAPLTFPAGWDDGIAPTPPEEGSDE